MFKEFLIEPEVLSNWKDLRYFLDQVGYDKGRLLLAYPSKWKKHVYQNIQKDSTPIKIKQAEELLKNISHAILKTNRPYDSERIWIDNVVEQNSKIPFNAVIYKNRINNFPDNFIYFDDVDNNNPIWKTNLTISLPRDASVISEKLKLFFLTARIILFIDPHFNPSRSRYRNAFMNYLKHIIQWNKNIYKIEIHCKYNPERHNTDNIIKWKSECKKIIPNNMPDDFAIIIRIWNQMHEGEHLHSRYILTDRGGVNIESGLDNGHPGETTDISLLSQDHCLKRWRDYNDPNPAFHGMDPIIIQNA